MQKLKLSFLVVALLLVTNISHSQWYQQNSSTNLLLHDIYFTNSSTGFAVGDSAIIIKTTNGGANWFTVKSPTYGELLTVKFINEHTGWAAGGKHTGFMNQVWSQAYYTTDGGSTWSSLFSPYFYGYGWRFTNIEPLSLDYIWFTTGHCVEGYCGGTILKTTNHGQNWVTVNNPGGYYSGFHWINNQTGWAVTNFWNDVPPSIGMVVKTNNSGQNWDTIFTEIDSTSGINLYFRDIQFVDSNTGYLLKNASLSGWKSQLYKSTNGGYNWTTIDSSLHWYWDSFFLNKDTGWLTGCYGAQDIIMKTINGGVNWNQQFSGSTGIVRKIFFLDANYGWALSGSTILHTTNGGSMGVKIISTNTPDEFHLFQNYPNPFNPTSKIKMQISKLSNVSLIVYDALGKEVTTLVNERLSPGTYEVEFNGSNYPSGVYFYVLQAGDFIETRKLVLLK